MSEHIPGPWELFASQNGAFDITALNGAVVICHREDWTHRANESRANARLIAAAPDMLAALKRVLAVADRKTEEFDAARAAIAKATGTDR
jgi:hypothetical protein